MLLTLGLLLAIDIAVTYLHALRHSHLCGLLACLACALGFNIEAADLIVEVIDINDVGIIGLGGAVTLFTNSARCISRRRKE